MSKRNANKQSQSGFKQGWAAVLLAFTVQTTLANPLDPSVVNGQASFATAGSTLTVTNTPGAIINWQGFSIGANEITRFAQQSASSSVLNRVISNNPSSILGALQSNGRVFLVNPNGIVFGAGATVDVAGLVATSLNLSNADFLAGRYNFADVAGAQNISNAGNLTAHGDGLGGGQIYLIAPNVENTGIINAPNGEILLAAGHSVELVNSIEPNLRVNITAPAGDATNVGQLVAEAGSLGLFGTVVKNTGAVSADSATLQGGKIVFKASQRVEAGGTISAQGVGGGTINVLADMQTGIVNVSGTLDASAPNSGNGGFIETSAAHVQVADTAHITTAAPNGKTGTWLIDPNDYTIAASGGDITGAQLSTNLGGTSVTIVSSGGATPGSGDINVNDAVSWSANTLTLTAARDININAVMTASGTSTLALDHEMFAGVAKVGFNTDGTFRGRVDFPGRFGAGILTIGGSGYTIINSLGAAGSTTGADLQGMNGNPSGFYALGSNIDASATSGWNGGLGFAPVGTGPAGPPYAYFAGRFDGLGHTITGLTINRPATDYVGLFGFGNGARIRNVGLNGGSVIGRDFVGGLVGYTWSGGSDKISNSYYTGTVTGFSTGNGSVGGLVGANYGSITDSYSTGNANGVVLVGGLVGWNRVTGAISSSYSTGAVIGGVGSSGIGGLVGMNEGAITNSFSTGSVSGTDSVGGLVGFHFNANITNSYSAGSVAGSTFVGGLVGQRTGGSITSSYWDTQTSLQLASAGGTGLTTAQMKQQASFSGWDFTNTWRIDEGVSYPTLRAFWTPPPPSNIFWDGGASTTNWADAFNWSNNLLPTSADNLYIGSAAGTVFITTGAQFGNAFTCDANFTLSGGSLTLAGASTFNGTTSISGGTLTSYAGLTVNDYTQTAGTLNIGGTTLLKSAGSMTVNGAIASNVGGTLTLQAVNNIFLGTGGSITGAVSPLNVILNSNSTNSGGAISMVAGTYITSNGGNITLGGGMAGNGSGYAVGNATYITGVELLAGSSISAGGGNITLKGSGYAAGTGPQNMGVHLTGATLGTNGAGTITINGTGGGAANSTGSNRGVRFGSGSSVSASAGNISITGTGGWDGDGVQVMGASSITSTSGNITLDGNSGTGWSADYGVYVTASDVGAGNTVISTGGNIVIAGTSNNVTAGSSNRGTSIGTRSIVETTGTGTISLTGNGGFDSDGLVVSNGALVRSANGAMILTGTSGNGGTGNYGTWITAAGTTVTSTGSGNIQISGTSIGTTGTGNSGLVMQSGAQVATSGTGNINMDGTAGAGVSDAVLLSGDLTTAGGAIGVNADTNLTMGSATKAQSNGGLISYAATKGSVQLGLLDAGAGSVYVVAGKNITDGNGASNNIKAGYAYLVASNNDNGPGSIDVDTQVPSLYVDNSMVYTTPGQPNNPVTVRNSGSALSVSVYSGIDTGQLTITNNNTINVGHIGGATNTTLTATGASSDISVAASVGSLLSAGNIILNAGRDILITHDYVDAGGTVTATAGRDIRLLSVVLQQGFAPTYIQAANGIDLTMQTGGLYIDGDTLYPAYITTTSGNINVVTSTGFANGSISGFGGTLALSAPLGRWLVYASSPATVTKNGLIPTLYQYNTVYGGTVAPTGNGFIYASPLYVDANFSGTLSSTYGTSPTATPGYLLRLLDLDSDDTATAAAITGSATYSNWPITSVTAAASYLLQYASGLLPGSLPYSLTPGTSQTYTVNPVTLNFIITASLTGTAGKTYDGTNTATLAPGNFLLSGFVNTDSATVTKTTGTYASPNVGSGILVSTTLTPADYSPAGSTNLSNYTLPTSASGPIGSITTAPLTVTANSASKIYNGQPFSGGNGVSYAGLVNGETAAVLGGLLTYSGTSQGAINNGSYVITPGGYTSSNYALSYANGTLSIGAASLFITVSLTGTASKTYDGTATATLAPGNFLLGGFVGTDSVTVTQTTGTYASQNVGSGILVSTTLAPSDFSPLGTTSLSNYTLPTSASGNVGSITVRPLSIWSGLGGNTLWSNPANWDALPSGNNVLAVSIPGGGSVTFDAAMTNTALQTLTSAGNMALNGTNLSIDNYIQTGGSLTGTGNLNVADSFSQSGGTITLTGAAIANITQTTGNLNIANLSAPAANLTASTGAITQTGPIIVAALATQSATGTTLTDIGNQIVGFSASNSASGNIALTNTGVLTIAGINNSGGDIVVDNTGAVATTGAVSASGEVSITAHSPITIGNTVSAGGKVTLTAGAPGSPVASDIITINGAISGSSVILAAHSVTGTIPAPAGATLQIYKEPVVATPVIIDSLVSNIIVILPTPEALVQTLAADAAATDDEKKKDAQIAVQDAAATVTEPAPAVASLPVCK